MRRTAVVVVALAFLVACSGDEGVLESGEPRVPDAVGVVADATFERIELEDGERYEIHPDVESFRTRSHRITSLLFWEGKFVHLGLDEEKRIRWVAGIGAVTEDPRRVYYSGVFERVEDGNAYFEDGTVLELADGVRPPDEGREAVCEIDPDRGVVTKLTAAA